MSTIFTEKLFFTSFCVQVTEYLHVKSFKRKYPDCPRRVVDMEERDFLMEMKIVNETQADLGLTAIPSSSVLDIMCQVLYLLYHYHFQAIDNNVCEKYIFHERRIKWFPLSP
jgi:hypothetical protein